MKTSSSTKIFDISDTWFDCILDPDGEGLSALCEILDQRIKDFTNSETELNTQSLLPFADLFKLFVINHGDDELVSFFELFESFEAECNKQGIQVEQFANTSVRM